ncbi:MAG: FAD-dependent oxidoreductase [Hyphomicrobiaceae bacterium]|nr:FAD-dependent oxidoreductase [Hyphomicrobiaceae bacterium]
MRIAVVGAGISGLGASFLLSKHHDVTLYEAQARIGGHSNTVDATDEDGTVIPVDTGFIVYNTVCYPNLIALFGHLGVATAPTEMSFSVSLDDGRFEYTGNGVAGLFAQRRNALSLQHWAMIADILRFFRQASRIDPAGHDPDESLGNWLARHRYGTAFVDRHIVPMGSAIWSTPAARMLDFPVASFARFFANHGLLKVQGRPAWRTVVGGSRSYVGKVLAAFRGKIAAGDPVVSIERGAGNVTVRTRSGSAETYQACVMACHADEALALIDRPTAAERALLGPIGYARNEAVLHTDERLMPRRRRAWTSWNYVGRTQRGGEAESLSVSYWMNRLQPLPTRTQFFVTLNPWRAPRGTHVIARIGYAHPVFDGPAMRAQRDLWSLQGDGGLWFAGSYFGYGFHEDGLQAGLAVAEDLGGHARPWRVAGDRDRILAPAARSASAVQRLAAQ